MIRSFAWIPNFYICPVTRSMKSSAQSDPSRNRGQLCNLVWPDRTLNVYRQSPLHKSTISVYFRDVTPRFCDLEQSTCASLLWNNVDVVPFCIHIAPPRELSVFPPVFCFFIEPFIRHRSRLTPLR